jgi:hypothetical protein
MSQTPRLPTDGRTLDRGHHHEGRSDGMRPSFAFSPLPSPPIPSSPISCPCPPWPSNGKLVPLIVNVQATAIATATATATASASATTVWGETRVKRGLSFSDQLTSS